MMFSADIGGIVPGSMPANSTELWQEGAIIKAMKVVENGKFQEERVTEALLYAPARYPGCTGARCLEDNVTDIKAQAAANQKGIGLILSLIEEYTLETVLVRFFDPSIVSILSTNTIWKVYMGAVQEASANAVRDTLKKIAEQKGRYQFEAEDFMDDGSRINLKLTVDPETGNSTFDFRGSSPQTHGKTGLKTT